MRRCRGGRHAPAAPEETAPGAHRFRVEVDAGETATLEVAETRPLSRRFALSDVTGDHVAMLVEQGVSREALEGALRPILDQKAEIAAVDRELQARRAEISDLGRDQELSGRTSRPSARAPRSGPSSSVTLSGSASRKTGSRRYGPRSTS